MLEIFIQSFRRIFFLTYLSDSTIPWLFFFIDFALRESPAALCPKSLYQQTLKQYYFHIKYML